MEAERDYISRRFAKSEWDTGVGKGVGQWSYGDLNGLLF